MRTFLWALCEYGVSSHLHWDSCWTHLWLCYLWVFFPIRQAIALYGTLGEFYYDIITPYLKSVTLLWLNLLPHRTCLLWIRPCMMCVNFFDCYPFHFNLLNVFLRWTHPLSTYDSMNGEPHISQKQCCPRGKKARQKRVLTTVLLCFEVRWGICFWEMLEEHSLIVSVSVT